jgi:hypothetical protein
MTSNDRYQIGTPEMVRKEQEFGAKWQEIKRSEGFGAFMAVMLSIVFACFIVFFVKGSAKAQALREAEREALAQAQAELEAACVDKAGSFLEIKSGYLCLANNTVVFTVDDALGDEAREITGLPPLENK